MMKYAILKLDTSEALQNLLQGHAMTKKTRDENSPKEMMKRVFNVAELIIQSGGYKQAVTDLRKTRAKTQN